MNTFSTSIFLVYITWIPSLRRYSWYIFLDYLLYVDIPGIYSLNTFSTSIFLVYIPWILSLRRYSCYIFLGYLLYVDIPGIYSLITFSTSIFLVYIPWIPSQRRYSWYLFLEYLLYVDIPGIYSLNTFYTSIFLVYIPWIPSLRRYSWYLFLEYLFYVDIPVLVEGEKEVHLANVPIPVGIVKLVLGLDKNIFSCFSSFNVFIVFYLKRLQASFERTLELQSRRYDSQLSSNYLSDQYDTVVIQALTMIISSVFLQQKCLSHFNKNKIINLQKEDDIDI